MRREECLDDTHVEVLVGSEWRPGVIAHSAGWGKAGQMFLVEMADDTIEFAYPNEMRFANTLDRLAREV